MRRNVIISILGVIVLLAVSIVAFGATTAASPPDGIFALNNAASQERAGVRLEVVRVVIARRSMMRHEGRDISKVPALNGATLIGEVIFKVTNLSDRPVLINVDKGVVVINDEQISYQSGDDTGGYLAPGGTQITSHLFAIRQVQLGRIRQMLVRIPAPLDQGGASLGAAFELGTDLSSREYPPRKIK